MPQCKSVNLKSIKAIYFRNLQNVSLELGSGMTAFVGRNGQGKTNLLDAISLGSQLKPIRLAKQSADLILFGEQEARVESRFENTHVSIALKAEGKKVKINDKPTRNSQALAEKVAVVSFVPEDLSAILGGASLRRRLLNQIASSLLPNYVPYYRQYDKALAQRNCLLKEAIIDLRELESFTEILGGFAKQIESERIESLELIKPYFEQAIEKLSEGKLQASLGYKPTSHGDLKSSLTKLAAQERVRRTTLLGPHLDDLDIELDKHPARFTASRGQARILILALKIAQLQAVHMKRNLCPILLLDDIVGELDAIHAGRLLESVTELKAQTFITTTHLSMLPQDWQPNAVYEVKEGYCCHPGEGQGLCA